MKKISLLIIIFLLGIQFSIAQIPTINYYVTDNAGILSPSAKSQLESDLRNLEKQTSGVQFVIYIENEYPKDFSLEEYSLKIAENNKVGKKGNDNGILLYIAVKDRRYRWEVGYGVESTLNSALLGRISREYLVPNFQAGNYEKGILQVTDIIRRLLLNSNDADIVALKSQSSQPLSKGNTSFIYLFVFIIILLMIFNAFVRLAKMKKPAKGKYKDSFYHGAAGGLFMGGFGRGGFGGSGGFGGFSGGGGGFGGGGFSGGWK